jgi:tetratricopeptide (TPR) repeat protein
MLVGATLVILALNVGVFGAHAQVLVSFLLRPALDVYASNKPIVDQAAVVIGTSVTAVTGGLAILKGFYYAEMNLPRRTQELIDEARDRHLHDRAELLSYVGGNFNTKDFLAPTILANPFAQVLQIFGWESLRTRARDVATSVERLAGELKNLETWREDTENRKVTAHLLRGACFGLQALEQAEGSLERKKLLEGSLTDYIEALMLRPTNLDALEGAALQAGILGDTQQRLGFLNRIVDAADEEKNRLRRVTALHESAKILNASLDLNEQRLARERLVKVTQLLDEKVPDERMKLANTLHMYGDVQAKRGKIPTARKSFDRVIKLFDGCDEIQQVVDARDAIRGLPPSPVRR